MALSHRLLGSAAATFDRAVVAAMQIKNRSVRARAERLSHDERIARLAEIRAEYNDASEFFGAARDIDPRLSRVRSLADGEVLDATWHSAYDTHGASVRELYLSHLRNHTAHARLFLARRPRAAAILVHGYLGGRYALEERTWPIAWLLERGLDVAIVVLPFHALRAGEGDKAPPFPGADPRFTNEGFRQAIGELRSLVSFLTARGAPAVGAMGMSLGGYTTALLATVEPRLAFAVPMIPLASIADFARDQGRLGSGENAALQHRALEEANWVVSPLARPPLLDKSRILVIGAEADRITPLSHAERIARHMDAPLHRFHGGHLLQFGRADAFRAVRRMLRAADLMK
jgi:pimeloyl-ACP methyl ester carboxylesterase